MGSCYSCHVSFVCKVHDEEYCECTNNNDIASELDASQLAMLRRSSNLVSMYSQKGSKGTNQDALTVWEDLTGEKDTIFCGVFDGHGPLGHKFSRYTRDNLPQKLSAAIKQSQQKLNKNYNANSVEKGSNNMYHASWDGTFMRSFNKMDEELATNLDIDGFSGGTTAVTVIKQGNQLIVGNLGDSRAVLCTRADDNHLIPVQLTVDMKPEIPSEALRVIKCGGRVFAAEEDPDANRIWMPERDCPGLAMTRAFGDFCLKDYGLISVPDVSYRNLTKRDEFVVIASDGVWDMLTNSEVINIVASAPKRSIAAKLLVKCAVHAWRRKTSGLKVDDCTAICLFLDDSPV